MTVVNTIIVSIHIFSPLFKDEFMFSIVIMLIAEINRRNNKDFAIKLITGVLSKSSINIKYIIIDFDLSKFKMNEREKIK